MIYAGWTAFSFVSAHDDSITEFLNAIGTLLTMIFHSLVTQHQHLKIFGQIADRASASKRDLYFHRYFKVNDRGQMVPGLHWDTFMWTRIPLKSIV